MTETLIAQIHFAWEVNNKARLDRGEGMSRGEWWWERRMMFVCAALLDHLICKGLQALCQMMIFTGRQVRWAFVLRFHVDFDLSHSFFFFLLFFFFSFLSPPLLKRERTDHFLYRTLVFPWEAAA
jgi:hypothetical protein